MLISPQSLRGGVDGDGPAILQALFIDPPAEVPDQQITLHLEVCDGSVKVLLALFSKAGQPFQFEGKQLRAVLKLVHHPLAADTGQFLIPSAVEVIAIPPPVGKMGEPCF